MRCRGIGSGRGVLYVVGRCGGIGRCINHTCGQFKRLRRSNLKPIINTYKFKHVCQHCNDCDNMILEKQQLPLPNFLEYNVWYVAQEGRGVGSPTTSTPDPTTFGGVPTTKKSDFWGFVQFVHVEFYTKIEKNTIKH
jgi:hypothetical protein